MENRPGSSRARRCIDFTFIIVLLLFSLCQWSFYLYGAGINYSPMAFENQNPQIESTSIKPQRRNYVIDSSPANSKLEGNVNAVSNNTKASIKIRTTTETNNTRVCHQTYFWGGGKAGSTSLFFTLIRGPGGLENPENNGPFVADVKKEPCPKNKEQWSSWVKLTKNVQLCSQSRPGSNAVGMPYTHILNGCPSVTTKQYATKIMSLAKMSAKIANATTDIAPPTFLFLVRDPVDRITSLLNDGNRRFGKKTDIEQQAANAAKFSPLRIQMKDLFYQGQALKQLLSVVRKKQILVIPMESMSLDAQRVVDDVMDHVGGERWTLNTKKEMKMNTGNSSKHGYEYVTLSNATTQALREKLKKDVQLLERLVGKRFSWSSWARSDEDEAVDEDSNWLTTNPI